jgi:plastocyanin
MQVLMMGRLDAWLIAALVVCSGMAIAQDRSTGDATGGVHLRIESSLPGKRRAAPAVMWLEPMPGTPAAPFEPHGRYTLVQKNRTFIPHLQVVPAGSVVQFPNEDPFFHNVFSLFDGKRFDLGLYEAGSSKSVTFPRKGVSYIFCNIHPEMSAIIIALDTSLYAIADAHDRFRLARVPPGDYTLHLWIEGVPQSSLDRLARPLQVPAHAIELGVIQAPIAAGAGIQHDNMYGHAYATDNQPPY